MAGWLKRVDGSGLESFKFHRKVEEAKQPSWLDDNSPVSERSVSASKTTERREEEKGSSEREVDLRRFQKLANGIRWLWNVGLIRLQLRL